MAADTSGPRRPARRGRRSFPTRRRHRVGEVLVEDVAVECRLRTGRTPYSVLCPSPVMAMTAPSDQGGEPCRATLPRCENTNVKTAQMRRLLRWTEACDPEGLAESPLWGR